MSGPSLLVVACGGATSLQDGGRRGYQRQGLSPSGPMDRLALAAANALVGNSTDAAAIELALAGGRFRAEGGPLRLALAGASCPVHLDGVPLEDHRGFQLRPGAQLIVGPPRSGMFAYLAVAGLDVEAALGSVALHLRAALGGLGGRALRPGDRLPTARIAGAEPDLCLDPLDLEAREPIRCVLGPQADAFTEAGIRTLLTATFTVSNRADRMGYQLDGPGIEHGAAGFNIVSDATVTGSVQVPGNGRPIVLMADRQTTGGYPKIATVISADLRRIAQRRPGEAVRFLAVEVEEAVTLARAEARRIAGLAGALRPATNREERLMRANVAGDATDGLGD